MRCFVNLILALQSFWVLRLNCGNGRSVVLRNQFWFRKLTDESTRIPFKFNHRTNRCSFLRQFTNPILASQTSIGPFLSEKFIYELGIHFMKQCKKQCYFISNRTNQRSQQRCFTKPILISLHIRIIINSFDSGSLNRPTSFMK